MDINRQVETAKQTHTGGLPHNDNRRTPLSTGRPVFPEDAVARIFKPSRSVMTSGRGRTKGWRFVFERRTAPFIEPLMGYTGGNDTLTQIDLGFPTLESAIRYAERQGLSYVVQVPSATNAGRRSDHAAGPTRAFSDTMLEQLGLASLQESYGRALEAAANCNDRPARVSWSAPMDVVYDRALSLHTKRSVLMNWAWTEYLTDQSNDEGMPEKSGPSRLDDVERALLALERQETSGESAARFEKAA